MPHYNYLIVGAGMTGDAAIAGIRDIDSTGTIGVIGSDPHPPYDRPPLTKGLWKGKALDTVWRKTDRRGVDLHLGRTAKTLDAAQKRVVDDQGAVYTGDKLLLATGGSPRRFSFADEPVIYYRTLDDYSHLRALTEGGRRFAVIGSGFIGSEIAAALAMNHINVTMLFPGESVCGRLFPRELAQHLNEFYRQKGVDVRPAERVVGVEQQSGRATVHTESGQNIVVDGVVAGIGITPNTDLARAAGLRVDDGIMVNEMLQTDNPDIYAAGDVAAFANPALGKRIRVEHEDNANTMGRAAGYAMAGGGEPYRHFPFFYSDLFELGYEAVGDLDARLETVTDWKDPFREGVVYYLADGRVRGVLLWNTWGQVDAARRLIAEPGPFRPGDLKGRLPAAQ